MWSDPKLPLVTVVIAREVSKWGHIGATIGRETEGTEGYRRDGKPQVKGPFSFIAAGQEGAAIGLENRWRGNPLVGSNPTPPATRAGSAPDGSTRLLKRFRQG